jgi:hypothetical protein
MLLPYAYRDIHPGMPVCAERQAACSLEEVGLLSSYRPMRSPR